MRGSRLRGSWWFCIHRGRSVFCSVQPTCLILWILGNISSIYINAFKTYLNYSKNHQKNHKKHKDYPLNLIRSLQQAQKGFFPFYLDSKITVKRRYGVEVPGSIDEPLLLWSFIFLNNGLGGNQIKVIDLNSGRMGKRLRERKNYFKLFWDLEHYCSSLIRLVYGFHTLLHFWKQFHLHVIHLNYFWCSRDTETAEMQIHSLNQTTALLNEWVWVNPVVNLLFKWRNQIRQILILKIILWTNFIILFSITHVKKYCRLRRLIGVKFQCQ